MFSQKWLCVFADDGQNISSKDTVITNFMVSTHLNDIGDDFAIGRKCLSVNRISAEFLRANDIGAV